MSDVLKGPLTLIFSEPFASYILGLLQQLNELRTSYIYGIIVLTATASVRLRYLLYFDRHASLAGCGCDNIEILAAYGLFAPSASGPLRCFHCDAVVYASAATALGATSDAICVAHRAASPACYVAKLACLHLLDSAGTTAMQSDARRFQTVLRRLRQVLDAPVFHAASAYGFDPNYLRLCAGRHFMRNDCATVERPGDLLQLAQEFEEHQAPDSPARGIDLLRILEAVVPGSTAPSEPPAPAQQQQQQQSNPYDQQTHATRVVATDNPTDGSLPSSSVAAAMAEADDRCIQCHSRSRNRVTLPCAHFLLCDRCLESLSRCPKCSKNIVATVTAFIT